MVFLALLRGALPEPLMIFSSFYLLSFMAFYIYRFYLFSSITTGKKQTGKNKTRGLGGKVRLIEGVLEKIFSFGVWFGWLFALSVFLSFSSSSFSRLGGARGGAHRVLSFLASNSGSEYRKIILALYITSYHFFPYSSFVST